MMLSKICGIILLGLCGVFIIRLIKPEYSNFVVISTAVLCIALIFKENLTESINRIKDLTSLGSSHLYVETLFKALGIGYLTIITSEICKKAGEEMFSSVVETAGKFEILALCIPLAASLLETAKDLL